MFLKAHLAGHPCYKPFVLAFVNSRQHKQQQNTIHFILLIPCMIIIEIQYLSNQCTVFNVFTF
jgi:hypothetical protein